RNAREPPAPPPLLVTPLQPTAKKRGDVGDHGTEVSAEVTQIAEAAAEVGEQSAQAAEPARVRCEIGQKTLEVAGREGVLRVGDGCQVRVETACTHGG